MSHVFVTSCVNANGDDINEMMDSPLRQDLSTSNFIRKIAPKLGIDKHILENLGYDTKDFFANDWALTCGKSFYQGIPCYFVQHSRIEHIYVDKKDYEKVLGKTDAKERQIRISAIQDDLDEIFSKLKPSSDKESYKLAQKIHQEYKY